MFEIRKGYKGFYYEDFGFNGIHEPSHCRHIVGDVCTYPDIYNKNKGKGYCYDSTKCKFRPIFEYHKEAGLHGCAPPGGR